ncbi:MAG TPA: HAD hydrolase family protein [Syntrophorhabdus sp.]|jgi:3-deoxy-D-manno-octulosonate 8-phosphate phosphatase (KDO 8-P phosphatase)|nr:MAG: 3-deoxy-D-manno-octulosonate 8-phosphate phosphatase KdsC [Deltaproteobacteria bacterium ADurb.Bin135]HNQ45995.1 HAD hydrolase family protein [Syntrophorhabdus sp.]HNY69900.1 HAD hydrolase family protein [Syntrophorhabdus sp.]HOH26117.1 HAD hydrolase family protein [Syntrophorhabdus sp.]HPB37360.1 HAD hydrolase family protein [Syntrophorhabdus sp.]
MAFEKDINNARERARKVKLFGHDIHGTLTTNSVIVDIEGNRRYGFWHMDGFADLSLTANDIKVAFLDTTSIDGEGLFRAKELKLDKFYYSIKDKSAKIEELTKEMGISLDEVGFLGCEVSDIPVMRKVGFGVATADARDEVKALAAYITTNPGGRGAMREVCEFILRAMGKWDEWVGKVTKMGYK